MKKRIFPKTLGLCVLAWSMIQFISCTEHTPAPDDSSKDTTHANIPCMQELMLYEYGVYLVYTPVEQTPGQPPESYSVSQANLLGTNINKIQATIPASGEYDVQVNFFRFECTECCKEGTSITSHLHLSYSMRVFLEREANGRAWIPVRLNHPQIKLECINQNKC